MAMQELHYGTQGMLVKPSTIQKKKKKLEWKHMSVVVFEIKSRKKISSGSLERRKKRKVKNLMRWFGVLFTNSQKETKGTTDSRTRTEC